MNNDATDFYEGDIYDAELYNFDNLNTGAEVDAGVSAGMLAAYAAAVVLIIAAMWRVFTKAKQPGWAAIVPIYNMYVTLKIIGRPWWWLLLMLIPFVNIIIGIVVAYELAKAFGKGVGFAILILILPFIGYPMLAWGSATYRGVPKH